MAPAVEDDMPRPGRGDLGRLQRIAAKPVLEDEDRPGAVLDMEGKLHRAAPQGMGGVTLHHRSASRA
jgi:hypothetical protein